MRDNQPDMSGLHRAIHPQEQWEWPIAVYLYMAGMGAGAFAVGLLADWLAHPDIPSVGLLLWGPILVALGAPFLILDLGKKTRFINAAFNPRSSWAARGFAILSSLIITGLVSFLAAALPDILPSFGMATPAWLTERTALFRTIEAIALILSFGTAAYTGIFLKSVKYVSLWNTWLLPVLFTFSALSTGAMALMGFLQAFGSVSGNDGVVTLAHSLIPTELALIVAEGIALVLLLAALRKTGQTQTHTIRHLALKSSPSLGIGLVVLASAWFVPPSARMSVSSIYSALIFAATALVLVGGFMLRYDMVKTGTKDEHPLRNMVALQYNWRSLAHPSNKPL